MKRLAALVLGLSLSACTSLKVEAKTLATPAPTGRQTREARPLPVVPAIPTAPTIPSPAALPPPPSLPPLPPLPRGF